MSEEEKAIVKQAATDHGETVSHYARRVLLESARSPIYTGKDVMQTLLDKSLREKEEDIRRDVSDGIDGKRADSITLNELFHLYMAGKQELKNSTRVNYLYMYKNYVADTLGNRKISSIKYSDIKAFYNSLIREKKFKPNSMEIINTILHPVFTLAVRDGYRSQSAMH